jgi:hypothetical protein
MFWNILFLRSPTREKYLRWLAGAFPQHLEAYERAYAGRVYLHGRYREWLRGRIRRLREKHGLQDGFPVEPVPRAPAVQLALWE